MIVVEKLIACNFEIPQVKRTIDMIVLHSTASDSAEGTINWFNNVNSKVSSHYLIDKNGIVYKLVKTSNIAWHAKGYNTRSVGIEIVQSITSAMTMQQRIALAELVISLLTSINTIKYLQGHFELTRNKTDPYENDIVYDLRSYFKLKDINNEAKAVV